MSEPGATMDVGNAGGRGQLTQPIQPLIPRLSNTSLAGRLIVIGLVVGGIAGLFAYTGGKNCRYFRIGERTASRISPQPREGSLRYRFFPEQWSRCFALKGVRLSAGACDDHWPVLNSWRQSLRRRLNHSRARFGNSVPAGARRGMAYGHDQPSRLSRQNTAGIS